jgi:hypothetical protein
VDKTNGLIEDLESRNHFDTRQKCAFTRIKENMSEDEREAVLKAEESIINDRGSGRARTYSCSWLSGVLIKNGYPISASTILRHMNGRCGCE